MPKRIALGILRGANAKPTGVRDPTGETTPRTYLFDDAFSPTWDESILNRTNSSEGRPCGGGWRGRFNACMPSTTQLSHGAKDFLSQC